MKNDLFSIGNLTVHGYGLMIAIGLLSAYFIGEYRAKRRKWDYDLVFGVALWSVVGGAIGAKLLYILVNIKDYIADPSLLLDFGNGLVVYGGIIVGVACDLIYFKVKKAYIPMWLDLLIPCLAIAQAFGRLGCFMSGCCYGAVTDSKFSITFTDSAFAPNGVALYPTQLMSSAANFLNFVLLMFVMPRIFKKPGQVFSSYLIFYSIGRFVIEFFRGDIERGTVGVLSTSQFISIFILILGIAMFVFFTVRNFPVKDLTVKQAETEEKTEAKNEN